MSHNFRINIDSIDRFSKEIQNESLKLEEIINYLIRITSDMDNFFDTPVSHTMKEALLSYLNKSKVPCDRLNELGTKVDLFNKNYNNIYNNTKISVGDKV